MAYKFGQSTTYWVRTGAGLGALSGFVGGQLYIVAILIISAVEQMTHSIEGGSTSFRGSIWILTVCMAQLIGVLPAVLIGALIGGVVGFLFTRTITRPSPNRGMLLGLLLALMFSIITAKVASVPLRMLVLPVGDAFTYPSLMFVIVLCAGGWSGRQLGKLAQFYLPDP